MQKKYDTIFEFPVCREEIKLKKSQEVNKGSKGFTRKYHKRWLSIISNGKILVVYAQDYVLKNYYLFKFLIFVPRNSILSSKNSSSQAT
jgi:hypothetical protein